MYKCVECGNQFSSYFIIGGCCELTTRLTDTCYDCMINSPICLMCGKNFKANSIIYEINEVQNGSSIRCWKTLQLNKDKKKKKK